MKQAVAVLDPWRNFKGSKWKKSIDVRDFILNNVTVYYGDESFLEGPTEATKKLWEQVMELSKQEREKGGVLDIGYGIIEIRFQQRLGKNRWLSNG